MSPADLLDRWLGRQLDADGRSWLADQAAALAGDPADRDLYMAISLVGRRLGKDDLALAADDLSDAETARPGWDPREWSVDQAARIRLLLAPDTGPERFGEWLDMLCATADVAELGAFYRGLPLYPGQDRLVARAAEGLRSNMTSVFEAVAHRNPFAAERFDERAWNHMVLKALFVGSALHPIAGLDARANPALARMLCDYAHERWAAGRPVTPELWRCVGPFADDGGLADLRRALAEGTTTERRAAALALVAADRPAAEAILAELAPDLAAGARSGEIAWDSVAA